MTDAGRYPAYVLQLATAYRFLDRFRAARTFNLETETNKINDYFDYMEAFFQSCWHIKDWIRNDAFLDQRLRDAVWQDAQQSEPLRIVADLANGTKHLVRDPKLEWLGASASSTEVKRNADGTSTLDTQIVLNDGRRFSAADVAAQAMEAWGQILQRHGLIYFRDPSAA